MGTTHAMKKVQELYVWDIATRSGFIVPRGVELEIHEFDYKGVNKVIFEGNGVTIRSIPAQLGKVMSIIIPRMAGGYHFQNDFWCGWTQAETYKTRGFTGSLNFYADL